MSFAFLFACASENGLSTSPDEPGVGDPDERPPADVVVEDTDVPPVPDEPDEPAAPLATILSPAAGDRVEGCDGVVLVGVVEDDDTPIEDLVVTWRGGGDVLWTGTPAADGTVSVPWDPGDGDRSVRLEVEDPDGNHDDDARSFTLAPPSGTPVFTWSRSAMDDRVAASAIGECVSAAASLPTSTARVWDDGDHTPSNGAADGHAAGRSWASWDQVNRVDCHLIELEVEVPACGDYGALRIASPWFDGMPINDNIYVLVDGAVIFRSGTSYGAGRAGPGETDAWLAESVEIPVVALSPGTNLVQIVVEEYASWGGLGYLEPSLVP